MELKAMVMRLTGLSSGMDIDSMVTKMLEVDRLPLNKLNAKKVKNEWLQDAYRAVNTSLYPLRDMAQQMQYSYNWPSGSGTPKTYSQEEKDAIFNKISEFVKVYNDSSISVKAKLEEKVERAYGPLTSDEKKAMSDDDIKTWESKAKQGLLSRDPLLTTAYNELRTSISTSVTSITDPTEPNSLASIGVTTGVYDRSNPSTAGKLYINSDQLKAAIEADPEAVIQLFTKQGTDFESSGIAQRFFESTTSTISKISAKAGSMGALYNSASTTLGKIEADIEKKIALLNDKINKKEDKYYLMFSTMEKAIANGNAQMSWLQSQFG
ncbi:flagellar filament capping protein FliD [Paenibacillus harenae]|uniref:Filament cap protein n=1 Tax=Paenibacillus harenae TaxID=306543 RepID=A0ABT9UC55_PAEHA|nr:flagellar filament capping protein FliD [Paenibacillus harenae]MDQ0116558.1 flagellar hook-associated protein 2 [Paenibacillus harenae]